MQAEDKEAIEQEIAILNRQLAGIDYERQEYLNETPETSKEALAEFSNRELAIKAELDAKQRLLDLDPDEIEEEEKEEEEEEDEKEEEEEESVNPFALVRGRPANLNVLINLPHPEGGNALSVSVRGVLEAAIPNIVASNGQVALDVSGLIQAVLEKPSVHKDSPSPEKIFADWLNAHATESSRRFLIEPGATSNAANREPLAAQDVTTIIARAYDLVSDTHNRSGEPVAMRHLIAAIMLSEEAQRTIQSRNFIPDSKPDYFPEFAILFRNYLVLNDADTDNLEDWDRALTPLSELRISPKAPQQQTKYDTDTRELPLSADMLGIGEDVRALADLICLKDSYPPLAIGLFGDWGSGKSTFMEMLRESIRETTKKSQSNAETPFVGNVAHVWFNAWHYNDANLWASLVTHLFEELHAQATDSKDPKSWLSGPQFNALAQQLSVVKEELEDAEERTGKISTEIEKLETKIGDIAKERERERQSLQQRKANATLSAIPVDSGTVHAAMEGLGIDRGSLNGEELKGFLKEAETLTGTLKMLVQSLKHPGSGPFWCLIGGIAMFAGISFAGPQIADFVSGDASISDSTADAVAEVSKLAGLVLGAAAWLKPHIAFINKKLEPLRRAHAEVQNTFDARQKALLEAETALQLKLSALQSEESRISQSLESLTREKEELEALDRGEAPEKLIRHFLETRAGSDMYREGLGIVSHIRKDFETMSELMRKQRENKTSGTKSPDKSLPEIDRIVLYIDDLDRCRHDKVVEVLEAIHLLLAFDLFVVVVGVDARWLHRSLEEAYARQLSQTSGAVKNEGQATASDYLEKIFQIPFWLRPLEYGERSSTYQRLVRSLAGAGVSRNPNADIDDSDDGGEDGLPNPGVNLQPENVVIELKYEETIEEAVERVQLTTDEIALINKLGPLAGKSPRAVKRMINLYRLIRVSNGGTKLESFLDDTDTGNVSYPEVLFWLAMENGCPRKALELFAQYINSYPSDIETAERIGKSLYPQGNTSQIGPSATELSALRKAVAPVISQITSAIAAVDAAKPRVLNVADLKRAYLVAMRFSFQQEFVRRIKAD